jgi:small subunit ribosomal protein S9
MPKTTSKKYTYAVGRRKSAVATIKLYSGKGDILVNGVAISKYFPTETDKINYEKPFVITDTLGKYHFDSRVNGGGKQGQVESLMLAVSRALKLVNEEFKPMLRQAGLLTVDSRVRERRMVGTGGKARRQKQSPKR